MLAYDDLIADLNRNITKHQEDLSGEFPPNKQQVQESIQMNKILLTRVTDARETRNIWCINIWRGENGSIYRRQAHGKIIYVKGTIKQINNYMTTNLTKEESIQYIELIDSLPSVISLE